MILLIIKQKTNYQANKKNAKKDCKSIIEIFQKIKKTRKRNHASNRNEKMLDAVREKKKRIYMKNYYYERKIY